ncbi:MAG TPA: hypothetical protein PLS51_13540 [Flavobacterium sp.]|jgi:hypothetical protein|nr:hypothetical protein [Flavobacterium sp.]HPJ11651.1 hypothetical protein [Flavobacterium sp.]
MESDKIETLIEKYFQGETSIAEEKQLQDYFSAPNVAQHLEQYQPMFAYFSQTRQQQFTQAVPLQTKKRNVAWLSVAASVVVLLGVGTYVYMNDNSSREETMGTYDDPEVAFRQTQKALAMLSAHVNTGIEGVQYLKEYEVAKDKVFRK